MRKRRTLYSIKAALKPNIAVTDRQVEEEKKRMMLDRRRKKMSAQDRLVFAGPSKTAAFNATFLAHVAWAFRMTSHLRNKIAGRGVAITRAEVLRNYDEVRLFWATSLPEKELETAKVLDDCSEGLRGAVERVSGLGKLPRITFVRDHAYTQSSTLDGQFEEIALQLAAAEKEGGEDKEEEGDEELGREESAEPPRRTRWDAILALQKPNDALKLHRDEILEQIAESVAKSEASRDPDAIPDPNDPPPVYVGYDYRGDGKANEKRVKKLMADINKSGALRRPRTIF